MVVKRFKLLTVVIAMLLMVSISGCAKKGICESCGKKAVLYRFTTTSGLLGIESSNTLKLFEDCMDEAIRTIDNEGLGLTTYTYEKIE